MIRPSAFLAYTDRLIVETFQSPLSMLVMLSSRWSRRIVRYSITRPQPLVSFKHGDTNVPYRADSLSRQVGSPTHNKPGRRPLHRSAYSQVVEDCVRSYLRYSSRLSPRYMGSIRGVYWNRIKSVSHHSRHLFLACQPRRMH